MKKSKEKRNRITTTISKSTKVDQEENLPGYPHYPASEDIMNSSEEKLGLDIENSEKPLVRDEVPELPQDNADADLVPGTSADVSNQDLLGLGDENLEMDLGDDEDLKHRPFPVDMEGKDLIVPGAELDDEQENIGEEDEENNIYSHSDN